MPLVVATAPGEHDLDTGIGSNDRRLTSQVSTHQPQPEAAAGSDAAGASLAGVYGASRGLPAHVRLLRPHQWTKSAFVLVGPFYGGMLFGGLGHMLSVALAVIAFCAASSFTYIVNDLTDVEADRQHPRKRHRPIASGAIAVPTAKVYAAVCLAIAVLAPLGIALLPRIGLLPESKPGLGPALLLGAAVGCYLLNSLLYSARLKHMAIMDVLSLAMGFVLRVLGGCAAVAVEPSTFLLNCTLFLAMYLAFGKRLGERKTMGTAAEATRVRAVQARYTDDLLRMLVVVTAVALLVAYTEYVQAMAPKYTRGFNLLWLTVIPAVYAMLRSIMLLERGAYDDPTELATRDRPFQVAAGLFVLLTGLVMWWAQTAVRP